MLLAMGFFADAKEGANPEEMAAIPLHERYRDLFPVTKHLTYLNHAAVAPLCRPAADAGALVTKLR